MPDLPPDTYLTISGPAQSLYKEKGSKFIGLAYPVSDESEIKEILSQLKKEYFDARHHCYAYILGLGSSRYRANDDGEPNHSAGDPILGQIRSVKLTNILVVVVRYFGGTKLGVSGLIQAYRTAASGALTAALIREKIATDTMELAFDYSHMNTVMGFIKDLKLDILNQDFAGTCLLRVAVRKSLTPLIQAKLAQTEGLQVRLVS